LGWIEIERLAFAVGISIAIGIASDIPFSNTNPYASSGAVLDRITVTVSICYRFAGPFTFRIRVRFKSGFSLHVGGVANAITHGAAATQKATSATTSQW
jgi:hypothetical protein